MAEEPVSLGLAAISAYGVMLMVNEYMGGFILRLTTQQTELDSILEEDKHALIVASLVMFGALSLIFLKIFEYIVSSGAFLIYVNFSIIVVYPLTFTVVYLQYYFLHDLLKKLEPQNPRVLDALIAGYLFFTVLVLITVPVLTISSVLRSILAKGYISFIFLVSLYGGAVFIKKWRSRSRNEKDRKIILEILETDC